MYDVTKSKVVSKRRKLNIIHQYYCLTDLQRTFLTVENIDKLSKAITEYAFRSGPIEDMHANNQLSQNDMMELNKYMVNKVAGLLTVMAKGEWQRVNKTLGFYAMLASDWDNAEPDIENFYV